MNKGLKHNGEGCKDHREGFMNEDFKCMDEDEGCKGEDFKCMDEDEGCKGEDFKFIGEYWQELLPLTLHWRYRVQEQSHKFSFSIYL